MFEVGQIVTYATSGICRIDARETRRVAGMELEYFVLKPLYDSSMKIMVPAANQALLARMRPALTRDQILALIRAMPQQTPYDGLEPEARKEYYIRALQSGDQAELAHMLRSIYSVKKARQAAGKQLSSYEESAMREAENMLHTEFAHALGIQPKEVADFIHAELQSAGAAAQG